MTEQGSGACGGGHIVKEVKGSDATSIEGSSVHGRQVAACVMEEAGRQQGARERPLLMMHQVLRAKFVQIVGVGQGEDGGVSGYTCPVRLKEGSREGWVAHEAVEAVEATELG